VKVLIALAGRAIALLAVALVSLPLAALQIDGEPLQGPMSAAVD